MKNQFTQKVIVNSRGITLIEILMVLGLLVILLIFALPSVGVAVDRAEMKATLENVQHSVEAARRTARMNETPVSMNISPSEQEETQTLTFSSPGKQHTGKALLIQNFSLPSDIVLVSDQDSFVFDERGTVKNPGRILLVSRVDESVTSALNIQ